MSRVTRRPWIRALGVALLVAAVLAPGAAAKAPTDPQAASQEPLRILRIAEALDMVGGPLADIPVLVADTGVDTDHPDLASRLFSLPAPVAAPNPDGLPDPGTVPAGPGGWDLLGGGDGPPGAPLVPDGDPSDPNGHGTSVSGVLGAAWNNGKGGAGIAPNARFLALRTCWGGDECYQNVQAAAFNWAADRGVRVISMSWLSGPLEPDLRDAILSHPNVLFVTIPSGNGEQFDADPTDPQPCNLDAPNVLCVSTSAPDGGLDCGAFGPASVDVAVPTRNNVTTMNNGSFGAIGCATSFAAPTAAGIAAILFGFKPASTPAQVRAAIINSARKTPAWAGKSVSGGVADVAGAVALFGGKAPPVDRKAPSLKSRRVGRKIKIVLSEAATLQIVIQRPKRVKCKSKRKRRCIGWANVSTSKKRLKAGTSRIGVPKKTARGKRLKRGSYRLRLRATDAAGNRSRFVYVKFKVGR